MGYSFLLSLLLQEQFTIPLTQGTSDPTLSTDRSQALDVREEEVESHQSPFQSNLSSNRNRYFGPYLTLMSILQNLEGREKRLIGTFQIATHN